MYYIIYSNVLTGCFGSPAHGKNRESLFRPASQLGLHLDSTWPSKLASKRHLNSILSFKLASKRHLNSIFAFKLASKRYLESTWPFKLASKRHLDSILRFKLASKCCCFRTVTLDCAPFSKKTRPTENIGKT